ncbi:MAG: hypothetical protein K5773_07650 [Pseudobutyrivibrio sp.]|nr:hypothetical protein [Pseudobutyrivibrio sp.]
MTSGKKKNIPGLNSVNMFDDQGPAVKTCKTCGRRIPLSMSGDLCRDCLKRELFPKVKDFINENPDVNEMVVSAQFGLDRSIVHEWIREGRLEYRK